MDKHTPEDFDMMAYLKKKMAEPKHDTEIEQRWPNAVTPDPDNVKSENHPVAMCGTIYQAVLATSLKRAI